MINMKQILATIIVLGFAQVSCSKMEQHSEVTAKEVSREREQSNHADTEAHKNEAGVKDNKEVHTQASTEGGVDSATASRWLKNGNIRFTKNRLRRDGQSIEDRRRLVGGQKPHTIVLSCSDSRVPPEVIFDQKLGEIFVVRTAGEALDHAAIGSIEYAVEHLGAPLLVVMAHESCGAVKAAFSTLKGGDAGSPSLNALVKDIHPRIKKFLKAEPSPGFLSEGKANASGVARDLVARSKIVSSKVKQGALEIQTAIYHLGSGFVEFYSEEPSRGLASETSKDESHH